MLSQAIRRFATNTFLTSNSIRYRIEYRCILTCIREHALHFDTLLDAGAGSGEMSRKLYTDKLCQTVIGIEPFPQNYSRLVKNYKDISTAKTFQASVEHMPVSSESVDCVLSTQVLEHIVDHDAAAREIARVIKPGGYAIISVPHPPEVFPNDGHVRPGYTSDELVALFSPHQLTPLHTEYFFTLPTLQRLMAAQSFPLKGKYLPIAWADREKTLSNTDRQHSQPYGITCLFRKTKDSKE